MDIKEIQKKVLRIMERERQDEEARKFWTREIFGLEWFEYSQEERNIVLSHFSFSEQEEIENFIEKKVLRSKNS